MSLNDFRAWQKWNDTIPPPKEERLKSNFSCALYLDKLWWCYSPVHQFAHNYEVGTVDVCKSEWEEFKACLSMRMGNKAKLEFLKERRRMPYNNIDNLPFGFTKEYIAYLREEERLPKDFNEEEYLKRAEEKYQSSADEEIDDLTSKFDHFRNAVATNKIGGTKSGGTRIIPDNNNNNKTNSSSSSSSTK